MLPGYNDSGFVQANLPRFSWATIVTQGDLLLLQNQITNIQSGGLPIQGINFRIQNGTLGLKNADTGLYNVPATQGADSVQSYTLTDGQI